MNFSTLFCHQAWADAALLAAVAVHATALSDERFLKTLRHILRVQRVFLAHYHGTDPDAERVVPHAFPGLVAVFRATAAEQLALVDSLTPGDLARTLPMPALGLQLSVADGLTQVLFHSQNHRGQCLVRLRECGATPPTPDSISWLKDRPCPPGRSKRACPRPRPNSTPFMAAPRYASSSTARAAAGCAPPSLTGPLCLIAKSSSTR